MYDPFQIAKNMAMTGAFQEAADLMRETADRTNDHVLFADSVSWGQIRAAARRIYQCETLAQEYEAQICAEPASVEIAA